MLLTPISLAFLATVSTEEVAAYGVAFLAPLKPDAPADPHTKVLPPGSVIFTSVLLKVAVIYARAWVTFIAFLSFLLAIFGLLFCRVRRGFCRRGFYFWCLFGQFTASAARFGNCLFSDSANCYSFASFCSGVGPGPLASDRQIFCMPYSPICPNFLQALDVCLDFASQVALNFVLFYRFLQFVNRS